jgi:hypothetical protein
MAYSLQRAVGLNGGGSFAPNLASDQQQVADLLLKTPLPFGGLAASNGPAINVPTRFVDGYISPELSARYRHSRPCRALASTWTCGSSPAG